MVTSPSTQTFTGPATGTPAMYGNGVFDRLVNEQIERYPGHELKIVTIQLKIDSTLFSTELGSDIYILLATTLDIPSYYRLQIYSPNNYFRTSKADFESNIQNNAQVFKNNLKVTTQNYGSATPEFIPFNLTFAKLTFTNKKQVNEIKQPFTYLKNKIVSLFK